MPEVCKPGQLWVPGQLLDEEYPIPTNEELQAAWKEFTGEPSEILDGVFGVYQPSDSIRAIASIDLCEVVRESAHAVDILYDLEPKRRAHYKDGTWVEDSDYEFERAVTQPIVQVVMNADLVRPDSQIKDITEIMRDWRSQNVYVAANTSTLPGCELATINHFMSRWMRGCFDAIVFPRNHDGRGTITKAGALAVLAAELGVETSNVPLVKIDDAIHHIEGFEQAYKDHPRSAYFIPLHDGNISAPLDKQCGTSLEAFQKADKFFRSLGVLE